MLHGIGGGMGVGKWMMEQERINEIVRNEILIEHNLALLFYFQK